MAATWSVTGDTADQISFELGPNPVTGHLISFLTGAGHRGSVFVPNEHYNPAAVRRLVQAQANLADEIGSLTS